MEAASTLSSSSSSQSSKFYKNDKNNNKELLLTHQNLTILPDEIIREFSKQIEYLDLSHNRISNLTWIYEFTQLKFLILDCNRLNEAHFRRLGQPLPNIKLLMLNKNELSDLERSITILSQTFPNLEYLSLHGNAICPDELNLQPFSQYANYKYEQYRSSLIESLPYLKFLDHSAVKPKFIGCLPAQNARVLTFTPKMLWCKLKGTSLAESYKPLPAQLSRQAGIHYGLIRKATKTDYNYSGMHSEGNRFISNNDL